MLCVGRSATASTATDQGHDFDLVAVLQLAFRVTFAGNQFQIAFDGTVAVVDFQIPQQVTDRPFGDDSAGFSIELDCDHEEILASERQF